MRGRRSSAEAEKAIMNVFLSHSGRARWKDFELDPVVGSWSSRKIASYLDRLVERRVISRSLERVNGRPGYTFYLESKRPIEERIEEFNRLRDEYNSKLKALSDPTYEPALSPIDRKRQVVDATRELLATRNELELKAMDICMWAPSPEAAINRFEALMGTYTPSLAGSALWFWKNREMVADTSGAMDPSTYRWPEKKRDSG